MEQTQNSTSVKGNKPFPGASAESGNGSLRGSLRERATALLDVNKDHEEGTVTKVIEDQTSKIPSVVYLALAAGSMVASAALATTPKRKDLANFVGLWAPCFLILGLYNKIVKTHGSDTQTPA